MLILAVSVTSLRAALIIALQAFDPRSTQLT
jgi:hypothetical protein